MPNFRSELRIDLIVSINQFEDHSLNLSLALRVHLKQDIICHYNIGPNN